MSTAELIQEYDSLPEVFRQEVVEFILFLKQKAKAGAYNGKQKQGSGQEFHESNAELDEPISGYEDYIMDWSL